MSPGFKEIEVHDSTDLSPTDAWEALAERVRKTSQGGKVLPLDEVWQGTEGDFIQWTQSQAVAGVNDVVLIRERERSYLYSERYMTRPYAEAAACAGCRDICYAIAQTVRTDSRTYPRPTPLAVFSEAPFLFSREALARALQEISEDPKYADILRVQASDGSAYLFSAVHMDPAHARSLTEWIAVGHLKNP